MRIKIGPYKNWIGPYQIADALCFWAPKVKDEFGLEDKPDWVHNFGTWLAEDRNGNDSWLLKFCEWFQRKRQRNIKIHIDNWDTWSMDHTLAMIVVPMLKQLQATKHGAPLVDDEDVPDDLKSSAAPPKEDEYDIDGNHFKRWDWVMDEMIWTFEQLADDDSTDQFYTHPTEKFEKFEDRIAAIKVDREGLDAHEARIKNGLRLFGKYYRGLWD